MKKLNLTESTIRKLEETNIKDIFKVQPELNLNNTRRIIDCLDKAIDALEPLWQMQSGNYFGDLTLNIGDEFNEKADMVVDNLYDMKNLMEKELTQLEGNVK